MICGCSMIVGIPERRGEFCVGSNATWCEDFSAPLTGDVYGRISIENGTLVVSSDDAAYVERSFASAARCTLSFEVRAEKLPTSDVTYIAQLGFGNVTVALYAVPGRAVLQQLEAGKPADDRDVPALPSDRFVRATIDVDFTNARVAVSFDGKQVIEAPLLAPAAPPVVRVGSAFTNRSAARVLRYDNVVFDAR